MSQFLGFILIFELLLLIQTSVFAQNTRYKNVTWCATSIEEERKCVQLSLAMERDANEFDGDFRSLVCKKEANKKGCMIALDQDQGDLMSLDAGEVFLGGRHHSLVPITQEVYANGEDYYYSVAVIKKNSLPDVRSLKDLREKKACFAGVGTLAGWIIPIHTLMKKGGMEIMDCNNHVKSAINYFGPSCAVNSLTDSYNPIGDNSDKFCRICGSETLGEKCTSKDPYNGYEGAFRCLVEKGEIAFLIHSTLEQIISRPLEFGLVNKDNFELLCKDGTRRSVDDFRSCNWGRGPSHAVVTSSAKSSEERRFYQKFLKRIAELYGRERIIRNRTTVTNSAQTADYPLTDNSTYFEPFKLFESSPRYGFKHDLMFQDITADFRALDDIKQTYSGYLEESLNTILGLRDCPVNRMTLCVTSEAELEKCVKMRSALKAQLLKPEMECHKGHSQINCMQAIRNGIADVAVFDAGDIYTAGANYDLVPFISEIYNLGTPDYYAVAVAKEEDPSTDFTYLKGKNTCHPGVDMAAGWTVPLALLISNKWIRNYDCNSIRAATELFSKSCVPGALSSEYNNRIFADNLCDLCHGTSSSYCKRDANEDYFGYTGAFRCLVEGGGQVAFLRHTTVYENTDGKRREFWARNTLSGDYELLCLDGTRKQVKDYQQCSLGKVKANAIVTRGGDRYNDTEMKAFVNVFLYGQQYYGSKIADDFSFSMFSSSSPYADLIFQDATTRLEVIPVEQRNYKDYLGKRFLRAKRIVDC